MRAYSLLNRLLLLAGGLTGAISLQAQLSIVSTTPAVCGFGKFTWEMDNHPGPITLIVDGAFPFNYPNSDRGQIQGVGPGVHSLYAGVTQNGDTVFSQTVYFTITGSYSINASVSLGPASCENNDGFITFTLSSGNPPYRYSIDNGATLLSNGNFTNIPSGNYYLYVVDNAGCNSSAEVTVVSNNDLTASAGPNTTICQGDSVTLSVITNADKVEWSADPVSNIPAGTTPIVAPAVTTNYQMTAIKGVCVQNIQVTVTVNPAPVANAGPDLQTCYEKAVTLQGSGGDAGAVYQWSPATFLSDTNAAAPVVESPTHTVTYALTISDADGCQSKNADSVTIAVTPPFHVNAGNDTVVTVGQPFPLYASTSVPANQLTFQWTPTTGLDNSQAQSPTADLTQPEAIAYIVQAMTADGCPASDTVVIDVYSEVKIFVPNAFTPNNDGHNDVLHWKTPGIRDFQNFSVFNRWGQQVFTTANRDGAWDGTLNGRKLEPGTYVWIAQGIDYKGSLVQGRGTVMLIQ
jgi:gliding motility-associated-like protein